MASMRESGMSPFGQHALDARFGHAQLPCEVGVGHLGGLELLLQGSHEIGRWCSRYRLSIMGAISNSWSNFWWCNGVC